MKKLLPLLFALNAFVSQHASANTQTLNLTGTIEKSVQLSFSSNTIDLGDMKSTVVVPFSVLANTDYEVSTPSQASHLSDGLGNYVNINVYVSKENSEVTITPNAYSETLASGDYFGDVSISVNAL